MNIRFFSMYHEATNINTYPKIYSRAINVNNPEHYMTQVEKFFKPLKKRGHAPVAVSAYFEKDVKFYGKEVSYDYIRKHIMRSIKPKAQIDDYDVVFVWDVKDLTMLPINHILELSMLRPDISATTLYMLEKRILDSVIDLKDMKSIKRKVDNIEDVFTGESEEMRKVAPMYDALRKLYNSVKTNADKEKESIIPHDLFEKLGIVEHKEELCQVAEKHQEVYHQRWKTAKKCLELVNKRSAESKTKKFANIVFSNQGVASAAVELLMANLSSEVDIENIFSIHRVRGEPNYWYRMKGLLPRIKQRFGENCLFIQVSSCVSFGEPFEYWTVTSNETFEHLYKFQRDTLLQ